MTALRCDIHASLLSSEVRQLDTVFGSFELATFLNLTTRAGSFALSQGDVTGESPLLVRVHSSCVTSEFYGACDCDCAAQLDGALEAIAAEGRGVLFYLEQEGRGAGLAAKARDRMMVQARQQRLTTFEAYERMGLQPDMRRYDEVAAMTKLLGIEAPFVLLTNNPDKVASLEREKLRIDRLQPIEHRASPFNAHYLAAKRRTGHVLAEASETLDAGLPTPIEEVAPAPLRGAPHLVRVARYLLPVALHPDADRARTVVSSEPPIWWRLHLVVDSRSGREWVVLTYDSGAAESCLVRAQPATVLGRFPLRSALDRTSWLAAARDITSHGSGIVVCPGRSPSSASPEDREGATVRALLDHYLAGRPAALLRAEGAPESAALPVDWDGAVVSLRGPPLPG